MRNQPHECPDWDYMMIYPGDAEMECCTCDGEDDLDDQTGTSEPKP